MSFHTEGSGTGIALFPIGVLSVTVLSYYAWGAEWMPLSVLLSSQFIDQMNEAITHSLNGQTGRAEEVGGILLGTVERRPLAAPVVRIEGFEPVPSEHRRGPSYFLSDHERTALARSLVRWNRHGKQNLQPVGFYRTHTRRGLYLDNDDFSILQSYFAEPTSAGSERKEPRTLSATSRSRN